MQLILWKVLRKHNGLWHGKALIGTYATFGRKKRKRKDDDCLHRRKQKWKEKCVDTFYHPKKKVKKKQSVDLFHKNKIGPFCVFTQTTTPNWGNQLLGRILTSWKNLYDILQIFFAQKEGIFASWKRPKKLLFCKLSFTFVIFYHFINLYQNLCYQSASLSLFIVFKTSFIMFIISKWKTLISTFITISFYQTWSCLSTWDQISVWINFAHLWPQHIFGTFSHFSRNKSKKFSFFFRKICWGLAGGWVKNVFGEEHIYVRNVWYTSLDR